jgi:hypothetical protein
MIPRSAAPRYIGFFRLLASLNSNRGRMPAVGGQRPSRCADRRRFARQGQSRASGRRRGDGPIGDATEPIGEPCRRHAVGPVRVAVGTTILASRRSRSPPPTLPRVIGTTIAPPERWWSPPLRAGPFALDHSIGSLLHRAHHSAGPPL